MPRQKRDASRRARGTSLYAQLTTDNDQHFRRALIRAVMRVARGNDRVAAQALELAPNILKRLAREAGFSEQDWLELKRESEALIDPHAPAHLHACVICGRRSRDPR